MNQIRKVIGILLFLISIGLFSVQMAYFYAHHRFQLEYVDHRLFYIVTILCVVLLAIALVLLFSFSKKQWLLGASLVTTIVIIQVVLLDMSNQERENITHKLSISPNYQNVFSLQENQDTNEAVYYRSYFRIFATPIQVLPYETVGEFKVEWLANDVAAVTYKTVDEEIQQFIATYGDRGSGVSYYYVAPEMYGVWQGAEGVEVISNTEGIMINANGESELFTSDNIFQFGTLAIVLKRGNEAVWTIALNENFQRYVDAVTPPSGNITLYEASLEETVPYILERTGDF